MSAIPVALPTGFLGAGTSTLLRRVLRAPRFPDTAAIASACGEIGLARALGGEEITAAVATSPCPSLEKDWAERPERGRGRASGIRTHGQPMPLRTRAERLPEGHATS